MTTHKSKIEKLIDELCPNGVEFKVLGKVVKIRNGKDWKRLGEGNVPVYGTGGIMGYVDTYAYNKPTVLIPRKGSITNVFYLDEPFWNVDTIYYTEIDTKQIVAKFFYYVIKNIDLEKLDTGSGRPSLTQAILDRIKIPLPPLAVQQEIVKILNSFTQLEAELEAELEARESQYRYYRNQLLNISGSEVQWKTLGELASYRRGSFPQPYGENKWYGGEGAMPFIQVADVGKNMRLVENTKQNISRLAQPKSVFVPSGTVVVTLQGSIGRVAVTQYDSYVDRTLAIFESFKNEINKKYFAYQLESKFSVEKESARGSTIKTITKEEFTRFKIPIPSLETQNHIVSMLDAFNLLLNDISIGLPAELSARRQQYEYYREKLLTFNEYAKQ